MKAVISGASGLIGGALAARLRARGHEVVRLVRREPAGDDEARWDPARGAIDRAALEGADWVAHFGGAPIAAKRWSAARKAEIRSSRVDSARLLSETLAALDAKPAAFVCASALGYYGDRADEILTEASAPGDDFLARTTVEWERATDAATDAGIRVVNLRIGVVLSERGDMPGRMLMPFKFGLGGRLGSGRQWMSWVHLDDAVGAAVHCLETPSLRGGVNVCAPHPATNAEFTRILAGAMRRPAALAVPAFALRIAMGEMADFALGSARLRPKALQDSGYSFKWDALEPALRDILGRM